MKLDWNKIWKLLERRYNYHLGAKGYNHIGAEANWWNRKNIQELVEKQLRKDITSDYKIEQVIQEFISELQWNLRASYNSSSCLNAKQEHFLEIQLWDLVNKIIGGTK